MRIQWRAVHTLKEEVASLSAWEAQSQRELDEWTEDTEGTTLPAVDAFSEAFGTYRPGAGGGGRGRRSAGAPGNGDRGAGRCAREQALYRGLRRSTERPGNSGSSVTITVTVTVR